MKKVKITYWTTTTIVSLMMTLSAFMYVTAPEVKTGFIHLGFPDYFRIELAIAKFIGAIALLIPAIKGRAKEWVYAGFCITFVSAFIAHTASGDPAGKVAGPVVFLLFLVVSYITYHKMAK